MISCCVALARIKIGPLLQTGEPKKQIAELLAFRDPLYKDVADVELRTGDQSIQYVVSSLIKKLENLDK